MTRLRFYRRLCPEEDRAVPSGPCLAPETGVRRPQECGRGSIESPGVFPMLGWAAGQDCHQEGMLCSMRVSVRSTSSMPSLVANSSVGV